MTRDTANIEYCTRPACLKATGCTGICSRENAPLAALAPAPAPDDVALVDELLDAHSDYQHAPEDELKEAQIAYQAVRADVLARLRQRDDVIEECARECDGAPGGVYFATRIRALKGK